MAVTYTKSKIDMGWSDKEYNTEKDFPKQIKDHKRHLNARTARGATRIVPPVNPSTPFRGKDGFQIGMPLESFLKIWSTPIGLSILSREVKEEALWIERNKGTKEHHFFQKKKMQWFSWSALITLEYCYPDQMSACDSFGTCLKTMILHAMNTRFKHPKTGKQTGLEFIKQILTHLNSIALAMWDEHNVLLIPNSAKEFRYDKVFEPIQRSKWWLRVFGKEVDTEGERREYLLDGPLKVIAEAVVLEKKATRERQRKGLSAPIKIPELTFMNGVTSLLSQVYGPTMNVHQKLTITSNSHCAAALCLLQLLCGSRSKGIIGANWFDRVKHTLDVDYQKESGITVKEAATMYNGVDYCIVVKRITKEKDKNVREYQRRLDLAKTQGKGIEEIPIEENEVADNTIIIKPILFMLLDRKYLDRNRFNSDPTLDAQTAIDVFMSLMTETRRYVHKSAQGKQVEFVQSPFPDAPMWGYSDGEAYQTSGKHSTVFNGGWNKQMNVVVKKAFSFIGRGQGTHMLRRLYVNRGYAHFSSNTMKETAFTGMTLGHSGFEVSLFYTNLIWVPALSADVTMTISERVIEKVTQLESRIHLLEKNQTEHENQNKVTFLDTDSKEVVLAKLPRAPRGASTYLQTERGIQSLKQLIQSDITPTWNKLYKLGVNRSNKQDIMRHKDFMSFPSERRATQAAWGSKKNISKKDVTGK